jgi:hypothetical protein
MPEVYTLASGESPLIWIVLDDGWSAECYDTRTGNIELSAYDPDQLRRFSINNKLFRRLQ